MIEFEPEDLEWLEDLADYATYDENCKECLAQLEKVEPAFLALKNSLPEDQQKIIDDYLSACEEQDHAMLLLAQWKADKEVREDFTSIVQAHLDMTLLRNDRFMRGPIYQASKSYMDRIREERAPEYIQMCRDFNATVRRIYEETGEYIAPIEGIDD